MKKAVAFAFTVIAAMFLLTVPPTQAQGTSSASVPGQVPDSIEKPAPAVLNNNLQLGVRLEPLLPDTKPEEAVKGYKTISDFVTAVRAAHDLGIPFAQLKCAELGGKFCSPETNAKPMKIDAAILAVKPDAGKDGAKNAANTAKKESKADLKDVNIY